MTGTFVGMPAFPDGLPVMAERRTVDLGLALARRLEGAVRVVGCRRPACAVDDDGAVPVVGSPAARTRHRPHLRLD